MSTHLRTQKRQQSLMLRMQTLADREPQLAPEAGLDQDLLQALDHLSERDREALLLVAWFDLSNTEAAKVQGCSAGTFAVRLHRSRQRLRQHLDRSGAHPRLSVVPRQRHESSETTGEDVS